MSPFFIFIFYFLSFFKTFKLPIFTLFYSPIYTSHSPTPTPSPIHTHTHPSTHLPQHPSPFHTPTLPTHPTPPTNHLPFTHSYHFIRTHVLTFIPTFFTPSPTHTYSLFIRTHAHTATPTHIHTRSYIHTRSIIPNIIYLISIDLVHSLSIFSLFQLPFYLF